MVAISSEDLKKQRDEGRRRGAGGTRGFCFTADHRWRLDHLTNSIHFILSRPLLPSPVPPSHAQRGALLSRWRSPLLKNVEYHYTDASVSPSLLTSWCASAPGDSRARGVVFSGCPFGRLKGLSPDLGKKKKHIRLGVIRLLQAKGQTSRWPHLLVKVINRIHPEGVSFHLAQTMECGKRWTTWQLRKEWSHLLAWIPKMAGIVSRIFWIHFWKLGGSGDVSLYRVDETMVHLDSKSGSYQTEHTILWLTK